ncbi:MAG: redoxin domain-containing protein [Fibrobacteraceae bacterium]|nr:redoxin domain-containing protein [Fibrobacteraceae bacterium]
MKKIITILSLFTLFEISFAVPWLGVTFKKSTYENHLALNVEGVHPNSGCFSAGIVSGDKIVGLQGKPLTDMAQVKSVVAIGKTGQTVSVEVVHDGKKKTLKVKLTDRPDDISSLTGSAIGSKIAEFGKNFYQNGEKRKSKPKVTLLDFWATWCGPCRKTLPVLANVYNKMSSQGVEVIGISNEDLGTLNDFYKSMHQSPYPLYRDASQDMWRRYGIHAVPTLMLLDENGYIKGVFSGAPTQATVEREILKIMNEK